MTIAKSNQLPETPENSFDVLTNTSQAILRCYQAMILASHYVIFVLYKAHELYELDPKPSDLTMGRVKRQ